jgi:hypothetical protein
MIGKEQIMIMAKMIITLVDLHIEAKTTVKALVESEMRKMVDLNISTNLKKTIKINDQNKNDEFKRNNQN